MASGWDWILKGLNFAVRTLMSCEMKTVCFCEMTLRRLLIIKVFLVIY